MKKNPKPNHPGGMQDMVTKMQEVEVTIINSKNSFFYLFLSAPSVLQLKKIKEAMYL